MESYVDDMLIKSAKGESHTTNHREEFERTRLQNAQLNLTECTFTVKSGIFPCVLVSERKIMKKIEELEGYGGQEVSNLPHGSAVHEQSSSRTQSLSLQGWRSVLPLLLDSVGQQELQVNTKV